MESDQQIDRFKDRLANTLLAFNHAIDVGIRVAVLAQRGTITLRPGTGVLDVLIWPSLHRDEIFGDITECAKRCSNRFSLVRPSAIVNGEERLKLFEVSDRRERDKMIYVER